MLERAESEEYESTSESSYLSDNYDDNGTGTDVEDEVEDDVDDDDRDDSENNNTRSKKSKKRQLKTKTLSLTEALKTVDERSLYTKIDRYFKKSCTIDKIEKMVKIINNEHLISLRLLNWFAMKYSATMQALEITKEDGKVELFDVKISYRARLDTHSKKYFDPFRRGPKFEYQYDNDNKTKTVETTLCQLNFFRWVFLHDLLTFVEENFDELKNKMGTFNATEKKKKEVKKEKAKKKNIKKKKDELKIKVKRFTDENTSKLIIFM